MDMDMDMDMELLLTKSFIIHWLVAIFITLKIEMFIDNLLVKIKKT